MSNINRFLVDNFLRKHGKIIDRPRRETDWDNYIAPLYRDLMVRVKTCSAKSIDTYEYLTFDLSTRLSERYHNFGDRIEKERNDILQEIKRRRDRTEEKV
jgi:hypothetical protein